MAFLSAVYRVQCAPAEVDAVSRGIALEQTVEVPEELVTDPGIRERVVGRVEQIAPVAGQADTFDVLVHYAEELAQGGLGQFLNLIYGNISLKPRIRLRELGLTPEFLRQFPGPKAGIAGIRQALGVFGRPLLATALKPRGSTAEQLAGLARDFAAGGGDLVKDDHNLVEADFAAFRERVERCQAGVLEGSARSGRPCFYLPNLSAPVDELEQRLEFLMRIGVRGVLVAPLLLGLDLQRHLAAKYPLWFLAHPTFTGAYFQDRRHGIEPGLLLGTIFRLAGCDGTIFPNVGGRFSFTAEDCRQIAEHARAPLGHLAPAFPAPAGGMSFETIPAMAEAYGADAMFLIGGKLLSHSSDLAGSTAKFRTAIEQAFPQQRLETPRDSSVVSACELPSMNGALQLLEHLRHLTEFRWAGRPEVPYKENGALPFRDVRRTELIGKAGERTAFDLRYFEIGPGGHSSLEKHAHTHVVITVRGRGLLQSGANELALSEFDVAYVPPLQVHQLRNPHAEPFGFFCIVDRDRDKPQAP